MKYNLTIQDKAVIYLNNILKLTRAKVKKIIEALDDVSVIFSKQSNFSILSRFLLDSELSSVINADCSIVDKYIDKLEKLKIEVFTILSDIYPSNLKEVSEPPLVLFAKGNLELLKEDHNLSVVGTRSCTNYGLEVTKNFVTQIASAGICIVSGLADGIDSMAHRTTLDVGGKTIAVMGGGFKDIYPSTNIPLANKIIEKGGLILTEYEYDESPSRFTFPARNRIIAGLSLGVLIIEAPIGSGSLLTKNFAVQCNREIFVVPGRITDSKFKGSNSIIKECQSVMVLSADEILGFFGKMNFTPIIKQQRQLTMEEQIVMNIIGLNDVHYEKILIESNLTPFKLNGILMKLEIDNIIQKLPGNIYTSTKI